MRVLRVREIKCHYPFFCKLFGINYIYEPIFCVAGGCKMLGDGFRSGR